MSDFDDLDDLFGPLRSPATSVELAAERDVVDLMVAAQHESKGTTMFTSRRARVATLIAAGILGFGGVAAASPAGIDVFDLGDPVETEVEEPSEPPAAELPEDDGDDDGADDGASDGADDGSDDGTSVDGSDDPAKAEDSEQEDDPEGTDDPQSDAAVVADVEPALTDPDDPEDFCLDGENHGKTVSAAARGLEPFNEERFDDIEVRDVARSSCGKTDSDSGGETDEIEEIEIEEEADEVDTEVDTEVEDEVDELEEADERAEQRTSPGRPDHAAGKSNNDNRKSNNGNGNGNGKKGG